MTSYISKILWVGRFKFYKFWEYLISEILEIFMGTKFLNIFGIKSRWSSSIKVVVYSIISRGEFGGVNCTNENFVIKNFD